MRIEPSHPTVVFATEPARSRGPSGTLTRRAGARVRVFLDSVIAIVIDAAVLGVIVVVLTGEFPGWGVLLGCSLAVSATVSAVGFFLPWPVSLVGLLPGAAVGAFLISWTTDTPFARCARAALVYVGVRALLTVAMVSLIG
jgi:hypothetical protein